MRGLFFPWTKYYFFSCLYWRVVIRYSFISFYSLISLPTCTEHRNSTPPFHSSTPPNIESWPFRFLQRANLVFVYSFHAIHYDLFFMRTATIIAPTNVSETPPKSPTKKDKKSNTRITSVRIQGSTKPKLRFVYHFFFHAFHQILQPCSMR